jgi:hypothetical protein
MDGEALDQLEHEQRQLARLQDRSDLALARLQAALEQAEQRDREAEGEAIRAEALAARERGEKAITRYAELATEMAAVMADLQGAEQQVATAGVRLAARGVKGVRGAEEIYWSGDRAEKLVQHPPWRIANLLRLPSPDKPGVFLWPMVEKSL